MYDRRKTAVYRKIPPRNICCEKDLYTIDPHGNRNRQIETQFLAQADGEGATAIRRLARGARLNSEWTESFSVFIALVITRSPAFRALMTQQYRITAEEFMRLTTLDVDRAARSLERYRRETGEQAEDVNPQSLVEAVQGGHVKVEVTERPFLQHMMSHLGSLAQWIVSFEWKILTAPTETGFILSDYPFIVTPPREHPDAIGFGFQGTVKYFPLNRRLCLEMGEQDFGFSYSAATKEQVRIVNRNIAVNSKRFIMSASLDQLRHVIDRSGCQGTDQNPRMMVSVVQSDREGSLIQMALWPRRNYFYPRIRKAVRGVRNEFLVHRGPSEAHLKGSKSAEVVEEKEKTW